MTPHPLSGGDARNRLFSADGRFYRGIAADSAADTQELFDRGVVAELVERGFLPATRVSNTALPGYPLVLEHESVERLTYSHEWTFTMLQDAAVFVLELRQFLASRGYDLYDAHCDNVTFRRARPIWLDFGSIVKNPTPRVWAAERRFLQSFVYPLQIWASQGEFTGRRLLLGGDYMPREAALLGTSWWARRLGARNLQRLCLGLDRYYSIPGAPLPLLRQKLAAVGMGRAFARALPGAADKLLVAGREGRLPFHRHDSAALIRTIRSIRKKAYATRWEDYHTGVKREVAEFEQYPRFQRILKLLQQFNPTSITEIGANQGALSHLMLKKISPAAGIMCLDVDDGALDRFYQLNRDEGETRISHAVIDAMRPFSVLPKTPATERFRSEAVVALAVTHHMVMGQCNSLEYVFSRLASFTTRWILVEYMPYGFHTEPVDILPPDNYSAARFDEVFRQYFEVIGVETLEPKRILYIGQLRAVSPSND